MLILNLGIHFSRDFVDIVDIFVDIDFVDIEFFNCTMQCNV